MIPVLRIEVSFPVALFWPHCCSDLSPNQSLSSNVQSQVLNLLWTREVVINLKDAFWGALNDLIAGDTEHDTIN